MIRPIPAENSAAKKILGSCSWIASCHPLWPLPWYTKLFVPTACPRPALCLPARLVALLASYRHRKSPRLSRMSASKICDTAVLLAVLLLLAGSARKSAGVFVAIVIHLHATFTITSASGLTLHALQITHPESAKDSCFADVVSTITCSQLAPTAETMMQIFYTLQMPRPAGRCCRLRRRQRRQAPPAGHRWVCRITAGAEQSCDCCT